MTGDEKDIVEGESFLDDGPAQRESGLLAAVHQKK